MYNMQFNKRFFI